MSVLSTVFSLRGRRSSARKSALLRQIPAFADLSASRLAQAARVLDVVEVDQGTTLLRQDTRGSEFFLIIQGRATVLRDGRKIAEVAPGDVFGEQALVGPGIRNATVVAHTDMVLVTSTRPFFASLLSDIPALGQQVRNAAETRAA